MFLTIIEHQDLINQEGSLEEYLGDLTDWNDKIETAKLIVASKLKNSGKKLRLLNAPFYFVDANGQSLITTSTAFVSQKTSEDTVERQRFVFDLSAHSGSSIVVTLEGTNDNDNEEYETVNKIACNTVGEYSFRILKPFKYYRLSVSQCTTRVFKSYLVEDVFFLPVLFKAISLIYLDLKNEPNSNWESKYKDYNNLFNESFESLLFSYDSNEDGNISTTELNQSRKIEIMR